jgi:hypothetical protein
MYKKILIMTHSTITTITPVFTPHQIRRMKKTRNGKAKLRTMQTMVSINESGPTNFPSLEPFVHTPQTLRERAMKYMPLAFFLQVPIQK